MHWKDFLAGLAPRDDLSEPFAAESFDPDNPALLSNIPVLTAAAVGARLLEILALRGATRIKPSSAEKLRRIVWRALPQPAAHLCDDEAARVLRWLSEARPASESTEESVTETPEVDIMFDADIQSRISVANFALEDDYDLELEYLDTQAHIWPRIRCTPVEVGAGEDGEPILVVESDFGQIDIPIHQIRWLMPVSSHKHRRARDTEKPAGKLLSFPTGDED